MTTGKVSDTFTVESGTNVVQLKASKSAAWSMSRIKELPLNGLNFQKLMLLAPGVRGSSTPDNRAISDARPVNTPNTRGFQPGMIQVGV
jgi:hypothetical protein